MICEKANIHHKSLSTAQIALIEIINLFDAKHLYQLYCKEKKKVSLLHFLENTSSDHIQKYIRPYVEIQMTKCFELLKTHPQLLFPKNDRDSYCYLENQLTIAERKLHPILKFCRLPEGIRYELGIMQGDVRQSLYGKHGDIIVNSPCYMIIDNEISLVSNTVGSKLKPFFKQKHIEIKKHLEKQYFEGFVKKCVKEHDVIAEGFEINIIKEAPRSTLELTYNLKLELALLLKFKYRDKAYDAHQPVSTTVDIEYNNDDIVIYKLQRMPEAEEEVERLLTNNGLTLAYDNLYYTSKSKDTTSATLTWLEVHKEMLTQRQISISQTKIDRHYYIGSSAVRIELIDGKNTSIDWFDINAVVQIGNFDIPFINFKEHILEHRKEYRLPNDQIFMIPEEWFEQYSELLLLGQVKYGKLKINKHHLNIAKKAMIAPINIDEKINHLHESIEEAPVPKAINATLRDYQREGFRWMLHLCKQKLGGVLADDMGLGKTLQAITLLSALKNKTGPSTTTPPNNTGVSYQLNLFDDEPDTTPPQYPSLIIMPTSLVHNWANEIKKFNPALRLMIYSGNQRGSIKYILPHTDIIVSTYGIVRNEIEHFENITFQCIILDESQNIKNTLSKTYRSIIRLNGNYKIALTGTPIENSLSDLWAQCNFTNPGLLGNLAFFEKNYRFPIEKKQDQQASNHLREIIAPFILRRTKKEVITELPTVSEQTVWCNMSPEQNKIYEKERARARSVIFENTTQQKTKNNAILMLQSLIKLRQIASHPLMIDKEYLAPSGKMDEVMSIILSLYKQGHKALIFSSFTKHLNLVKEQLKKHNITNSMLTGETRNREQVVSEFQNDIKNTFLLISLKAGGVGLNLTAASYVLILDPWWNPAAEQQAIGRAHRMGQFNPVMVYRFISKNTVEEKVQQLQQRKSQLSEDFIAHNRMTDDEIKDILS